jgi:hypothetical protein
MKKFLLSLCILFTAQMFAINNSESDTIKIVINGDIIQIEADNAKEIEDLLQHDIQQLFQNIYLNLAYQNDSSKSESLHMELFIQGDSSTQKIVLETDVDTEEIVRQVKNVVKISDEGVQIVQREQEVEKEEDENIIQLLTEIKNSIEIEKEDEQEEEKNSRTFSMTEIHLGFNNYFNSEQQIPSGVNYDVKPINSISFSYNKYAKTRIFAKGPLFLKYGIGLTSNNYKFSEPVQLVETENEIQFVKHEGHDVKKSKLSTLFVDVPLMLQIDLSKNKTEEGGFNIAAGPYVGYMLKSKSKYVYSDANGNENKDKEKGDFYVNKIRYGLQGQMGVLGLNFIARYELTNLFEDQKGPEKLNAFNFGIIFDI